MVEISRKEIIKRMVKSLSMIIYVVIFLFATAVILSAVINIHLDNKQSVEYRETTAYISRYEKHYNPTDEGHKTEYKAYYVFRVQGKKYETSPRYIGVKSEFKEKIKVKYDPTDPSVNIPETSYLQEFIFAIVLYVVLVIALVRGYDTEKKALEYYATHDD